MADNNSDEITPPGSRFGSGTSRQLGPVRTGHETPPNKVRPASVTSLKDVEQDIATLDAKRKDPLPPIGLGAELKNNGNNEDIHMATSQIISEFRSVSQLRGD